MGLARDRQAARIHRVVIGVPRKFAACVPLATAYAKKDASEIARLTQDGVIASPPIEMLGLWDAVTSPHCARRHGLGFVDELGRRPLQFDFSSLSKIHNEETPLDPIRPRTFLEGEFIDRSVRDRIKTQEGYFPAIASVPTTLVDWLQGLIAYPLRALT